MITRALMFCLLLLSLAYGSELVKARKITFQCPEKPRFFTVTEGRIIQKMSNGNFLACYASEADHSRFGIFDANGKMIKPVYFKSRGSDKAYPTMAMAISADGFSLLKVIESRKIYMFDNDGNELSAHIPALEFLIGMGMEIFKNKYYITGFGNDLNLGANGPYQTTRHYMNCVDFSTHQVRSLLSITDSAEIAHIRELDAPFDRLYCDANPKTGLLAVSWAINPDVWIIDASSDTEVAHYTIKPQHYKDVPPRVLYGQDWKRWYTAFTYTNVPFWLNDTIIALGRSVTYQSDPTHIDIYTVTRGLIESIRADKQYIFADNDTLYFLDSVDTVNNTFTLEARTVKW